MAKDKSTKKSSKTETKPLTSVKGGRVTKPAEAPKAKSKDIAKKTAKVAGKDDKKSKKSKKEPTPEPSSSESESSDEDMSDASSSESEVEAKAAPAKTNGVSKAALAAESSSSDSSESDSESDSESSADEGAAAPKAAKAAVTKAEKDTDSSEEESSDDSSDEAEAPKVGTAAKDEDASTSESDDDTSDGTSESEDEEEEEKPVENKKRKADAETTPATKKTKTEAPSGGHQGEKSEPSKNLFVGGLSWNVDEDWLSREFEGFGEMVSARVITHADTGRSKGFAYVEFADVESATKALEAKDGQELDGRPLRIDFSQPRPDRSYNRDQVQQRAGKFGDNQTKEPSSTLFIGNVSFNATQDVITEYFQEYGTINAVRLPTDRETGAPKGFGYVEFSSIDEAKAALDAMNGVDIEGRNIRLDYAGERANGGGDRGGFGGGRGGGRGGRGGFGDRGGRGGFGDRGGRGGRGGFGGRGGGRGGARGGRGGTTNRGGFGDFKGQKVSFD